MTDRAASPAFDIVKQELLADPDDDVAETREGLVVKGVLFAFQSSGDGLVVDLPKARAADLVQRGVARAYTDARAPHGQWVAVADSEDSLELATEAHQFVGEPPVGRQS